MFAIAASAFWDMMKHRTCCHQIERSGLHRAGNDVALAQFKI